MSPYSERISTSKTVGTAGQIVSPFMYLIVAFPLPSRIFMIKTKSKAINQKLLRLFHPLYLLDYLHDMRVLRRTKLGNAYESCFSCMVDAEGDPTLELFLLSGAQQHPMAACNRNAKSVDKAAIHMNANILAPISH